MQTICSQKSFLSYYVIASTNTTFFAIFKFSNWQLSEYISGNSSYNSFQPAGLCLRIVVIRFSLPTLQTHRKHVVKKKEVALFKERLFCLIKSVGKITKYWDIRGVERETLSVWTKLSSVHFWVQRHAIYPIHGWACQILPFSTKKLKNHVNFKIKPKLLKILQIKIKWIILWSKNTSDFLPNILLQ